MSLFSTLEAETSVTFIAENVYLGLVMIVSQFADLFAVSAGAPFCAFVGKVNETFEHEVFVLFEIMICEDLSPDGFR